MKIIISAVLLAAAAGTTRAGELENAAVAAVLSGNILAGAALPYLSSPVIEVKALADMQPPSAGWVRAVKTAYRSAPTGGLPPAKEAELPAAALQQLREDAVVYPSRAYRIEIDGRTAFVIENDNYDALYVNIFDESGEHIAYGGYDENYDFYWLK